MSDFNTKATRETDTTRRTVTQEGNSACTKEVLFELSLLKTSSSTSRAREQFSIYIELMRTQEFEQSDDTPEHKEYMYALDRLLDASVHVDDDVLMDALDHLPVPHSLYPAALDIRSFTAGCDSVRKWMESIRLDPSSFQPRLHEGT